MTSEQNGCCGGGSCADKKDAAQGGCCSTGKCDPRTSVTVISLLVAAGALAFAFTHNGGGSYAPKMEPGKVLAKINGKPVSEGDVKKMVLDQMPDAKVEQLDKALPQLTQQYINIRLLDEAAEKSGVAKAPEMARQLDTMRHQALRAAFLKKEAEAKISDADIEKTYKELFPNNKLEEKKAKHILVKTEDEAKAIIAELEKGADFGKIAKEKSLDQGSAKEGGELGWFQPTGMVKPFADAVSAMKKDETTKTPVQTQFGWHVIRLEDSRERPAPALQEAKEQIRQQLIQKQVDSIIEQLRKDAKVELVEGGAGAPPAAPAPAPAPEAAPADKK